MMSGAALAATSRILASSARSLAVVVDPLAVERGLPIVESSVDGLAVDLGGPLPIRAVELGRIRRGSAQFALPQRV